MRRKCPWHVDGQKHADSICSVRRKWCMLWDVMRPQVRCASGGAMPRLTQHLWLGKADADAAATSLAPKLRTSRDEIAALLSDAVSLEVRCRCLPHAPTTMLKEIARKQTRKLVCVRHSQRTGRFHLTAVLECVSF